MAQAANKRIKMMKIEWDTVLAVAFWILVLGAVIWGITYLVMEDQKAKAEEQVLIETTTFEIEGTIESTREAEIFHESMLGNYTDREFYIKVNGEEFFVSDTIKTRLETGQRVLIKGYDGKLKEVSIIK